MTAFFGKECSLLWKRKSFFHHSVILMKGTHSSWRLTWASYQEYQGSLTRMLMHPKRKRRTCLRSTRASPRSSHLTKVRQKAKGNISRWQCCGVRFPCSLSPVVGCCWRRACSPAPCIVVAGWFRRWLWRAVLGGTHWASLCSRDYRDFLVQRRSVLAWQLLYLCSCSLMPALDLASAPVGPRASSSSWANGKFTWPKKKKPKRRQFSAGSAAATSELSAAHCQGEG